jgi:group I intron endonuclease
MQRHKKAAIDGGDTKFCRAIRKYGGDNFKYEVLFTIDTDDIKHLKEKLDFMERYYIRKFHSYENGYNMTLGGDGAAGTKHTEEFKQRQSERMKNNNPAFNMTDEWRQHIGDS